MADPADIYWLEDLLPEAAEPRAEAATVVLVENDAALRGALAFALEVEGYQVKAYEDVRRFLSEPLPRHEVCLVLDEEALGISALAAVAALRRRGVQLPAVVLSGGRGGEPSALAPETGVSLICKPLVGEELPRAVREALAGWAEITW